MSTRRQPRATTVRRELYVGGRWIAPAGAEAITVVDPTTAQPLGSVPAGAAADVEVAVAAATQAFPGWADTAAQDRGRFLSEMADMLGRRSAELAELIALEVGMPEAQCLHEQ